MCALWAQIMLYSALCALPPFGGIKQNRRRKATPRTHISILISQIFAVLSKKWT